VNERSGPGAALIVAGLGDRGALAGARALAGYGWRVGVASQGVAGGGLAASSRAVSARHRVPPPQPDLDAFVAAVRSAVDEGAYEVVFSGGVDAETMALSLRRAELGALVPFPAHERVVTAFDKLHLAEAAASVGMGSPVTGRATAAELDRVPFPAIVKARHHAPLTGLGGPSWIQATICRTREEAMQRSAEIRSEGAEPIVQELVGGSLIACAAIAADSSIVARAQQVAERTYPPRSGVSSRARTVAPDASLWDRVSALLALLQWSGLVELQFILSPSRGPVLIDFNGRFYGSMTLACAAGVNLPAIWAATATGRPLPGGREARPGVRYQWLEGDLRRAWIERRGGLAADLLETARAAVPPTVHSVWRTRDPKPAAYLAGVTLRRALGRRD
jgi:predicted ATP-grasp superfamily ATP-dependent carboligase